VGPEAPEALVQLETGNHLVELHLGVAAGVATKRVAPVGIHNGPSVGHRAVGRDYHGLGLAAAAPHAAAKSVVQPTPAQ
jgi:hypothetical protein